MHLLTNSHKNHGGNIETKMIPVSANDNKKASSKKFVAKNCLHPPKDVRYWVCYNIIVLLF